MKTKHEKNAGQMIRKGQIDKLPGGAKLHRGALARFAP